jgi:aryl-alcohol dehydrogenase-like predicted oxidoreductase
LKYILSHPAVTVTIPATSRTDHMDENMGTLIGLLPDSAMRKQMQNYYQTL